MEQREKDFLEKIFSGNYDWLKKTSSSLESLYFKQMRWKEKLGQPKELYKLTRQNIFAYSSNCLKISFSLTYYCEKVGDELNPLYYFWFDILVEDEFRRLGRKKLYEVCIEKTEEAQWLTDCFFRIRDKAAALPTSASNVLQIELKAIEELL